MTLSEYITAQGRGAISALAKQIGAPIPDVSRWVSGDRPVPAGRCVAIEAATGGAVTRKDLKPLTWKAFWPELAKPQSPKRKEVAHG